MQNPSPLSLLQQRLASGDTTPEQVAAEALTRSNTNASHNVYLTQDPARITTETQATSNLHPPLYGIPISLKDCFDLRGYTTSCGSRFYADHNTPALEDSGSHRS